MQGLRHKVRWLGAGLIAGTLLTQLAVQAQPQPLVSLRGFAPLLALFGRDEAGSVSALRKNLGLWELMVKHGELEPTLQRIGEEVLDSLSDFDLEALHGMLPVDKKGSIRELHVRSELQGQRYLTRAAQVGDEFEVCATCSRRALGDASLFVRSQPIIHGDDTHYLLEARAGATIAALDFRNVLDAQRQWWMLLGSIDPKTASPQQRPLLAYRVDSRTFNPGLDAREFEAVAVLSQSFPFTGRLLRSLGRVEDLWADPVAENALHMRLRLRLDPKRMAEHYPELASWFAGLDELMKADIRLLDSEGRTLLRARVDTEHLRMNMEFHVQAGQLLPFDGKHVYAEAPLRLDTAQRLTFDAAAQMDALGVRAQVRRMRGTLRYEPTASGVRASARVTRTPEITISGAALGFVPLEVVNVFVPDDIHGLAMRFIRAAVKGNKGKGIQVKGELAYGSDGHTTVQGSLALEALDNFFVRLGVGYWNAHIAPNADAVEEIVQLQEDALSALSADVSGYAHAAKTRPASPPPR